VALAVALSEPGRAAFGLALLLAVAVALLVDAAGEPLAVLIAAGLVAVLCAPID
jgi:hypothetical protein